MIKYQVYIGDPPLLHSWDVPLRFKTMAEAQKCILDIENWNVPLPVSYEIERVHALYYVVEACWSSTGRRYKSNLMTYHYARYMCFDSLEDAQDRIDTMPIDEAAMAEEKPRMYSIEDVVIPLDRIKIDRKMVRGWKAQQVKVTE